MSKIHSILYFLRCHKNAFLVVVSAIFVCFIDSNNIWERHYRWQTIDELKNEIAGLEASFEADSRELEELRTNPRKVEQIAREKYQMTRPGEDLFIIVTDDQADAETASVAQDDGTDPEV